MSLINEILQRRLLSLAVVLLIGFHYGKQTHELERWEELRGFQTDGVGYYVYLPAAFIYQDFTYAYADEIHKRYPGYWFVLYSEDEQGNRLQKYPLGTAFMNAPFFLIAHLTALNSDEYEADGYSKIYHRWIAYASLIYAILALFMISKVVGLYFSDLISALVVLFIGLGTNLYYYASFESGLSHMPGLFLLGLYVYHCIQWFRSKRFVNLFLMTIALAVATVVRPTNILFGLLFVGLLIENRSQFKEYWYTLVSYKWKWTLLLVIALIVPVLQMTFWYHSSGSIIQYSYGEEGFFFNKPHVLMGLFSGRNSLFPYSIPFVLSILGLFIWFRKIPNLTIIVVLGVFYYVIYSWWCWWYGGSYGSRAAIESYPLLALLLAVCLNFIIQNAKPVHSLFLLALFFMTTSTITLRFTDLRYDGMLHYDSMTWPAYLYLWNNDPIETEYFELWEQPDHHTALKTGEEYTGFDELNTRDKYSEEILFNVDTNVVDTILVEFELWGNSAFYGNSVIFMEALNEDIGFYQRSGIKPNIERIEWNTGVFKLPVQKQWHYKEIRFRLIYEGKRRMFYRPIRFPTDKP